MTPILRKPLLTGGPYLVTTALAVVLAACGGGGGGSSAPTTAPSAPTNVVATPGNSQVSVTWTASSGASSYNLYWGDATGVTPANGTKTAGVTSPYTETGLTNGTPYYCVLTAVNSAGESPASAQVNATPWITAPTGLHATPGDTTVTLNWSPVTGAASYNAYWSQTTGVTPTSGTKVAGVTSPYTQSGLTNGTPYYYVVTALDSHGESAASSQATATPALIAAPAGLQATPGNASVTLTWSPVTGATSYNAYESQTTGVTPGTGTKLAGVTSPYTQTGLTDGVPYYYVVTALDSKSESAPSSQVTATPAQVAAPAAPTGLTATVGNLQVTLGWTPVSGATGYNVYRGTSSGALASKTKLTSTAIASANYVDTTVANANIYYYQVTAVGAGGESAGSNEMEAPVINLTGSNWSISETVVTNTCGSDIGTVSSSTSTITQASGTTSFTGTMATGGSFSGSVSGQNVTMTGSMPYTAEGYPGTLAFQATATWSNTNTAISFTGTATYQFTYKGTTYCTGTMTIAGNSSGI